MVEGRRVGLGGVRMDGAELGEAGCETEVGIELYPLHNISHFVHWALNPIIASPRMNIDAGNGHTSILTLCRATYRLSLRLHTRSPSLPC